METSLRLVGGGAGLSLKLASEVAAFASDSVVWRPLSGVSLDVVISAAWRPDRTTPALAALVPLLRSNEDQSWVPPGEPRHEEIEALLAGKEPSVEVATKAVMEVGDRMLIPCSGGPSISRLVRYPPPLEIEERGGTYVLEDDGPPELWRYRFVRG